MLEAERRTDRNKDRRVERTHRLLASPTEERDIQSLPPSLASVAPTVTGAILPQAAPLVALTILLQMVPAGPAPLRKLRTEIQLPQEDRLSSTCHMTQGTN